MVKLIATDMDGTFLDGRGSFDRERFSTILSRLEDKNIPFVVASGNGIGRLLQLFQGFEDRLIFVADNGAHIYQKGQTLLRRTIDERDIRGILEFFRGRWTDVCLMLANDQAIYMQEGTRLPFSGTHLPIESEQVATFLAQIRFLENLSDYPSLEPIYKTGLWVEENQVDEVTQAFNQAFRGRLVAVTSGYGSIDILPQGIHKAWGLRHVLEDLEIPSEQVMAFGDSDNDLELLAYAGHSYAMENASAKVKAFAKYLAPHHTEAGVMRVIEESVL